MKKYIIFCGVVLLIFNSSTMLAQQLKVSLQQAISFAKENNKTVRTQYLAEDLATESIMLTKGTLLPTLSASGNYSYYFDRQVIFMPGAFVDNDVDPVVDVAVGGRNTFNTAVNIHQPIVSPAAKKKIKGARLGEEIQKFKTADQLMQLEVDLTSNYLNVLLISEILKLNKQSLNRNIQSLDDSRALMQQGKGLKMDTLRSFIVVENLKTTIAFLESQYEVMLLQLKQTMGLEQDRGIVLTDSLVNESKELMFDQSEALVFSRPDIQVRKTAVQLNKNLLEQSIAQRMPAVSLVGAYQLQAQSDSRPFDGYRWPRTSFVGLQASVPLFNGNRTNTHIAQSRIRLQSSELELQNSLDRAMIEVASRKSKFQEAQQRLSAIEKTINAAEMNFKIVNDRYKFGLSSRLEFTDAELALTEARMNRLQAIYNMRMAKVLLEKALGI